MQWRKRSRRTAALVLVCAAVVVVVVVVVLVLRWANQGVGRGQGDSSRRDAAFVSAWEEQTHVIVPVADETGAMMYYTNRDLPAITHVLRQRCSAVTLAFPNTGVKHPHVITPTDRLSLCFAMSRAERVCDVHAGRPHVQSGSEWFNMFPALRTVLWRKDSFCSAMEHRLGPLLLDTPGATSPHITCAAFRNDDQGVAIVRAFMAKHSAAHAFVIRPSSRGEGKGIFTADDASDVERVLHHLRGKEARQGFVISPLLNTPLLVHGHKVDLRCYVLLTEVAPMRAFLLDDCLVRFALAPYDATAKRGGSRAQWMTNTYFVQQHLHQRKGQQQHGAGHSTGAGVWRLKGLCEYVRSSGAGDSGLGVGRDGDWEDTGQRLPDAKRMREGLLARIAAAVRPILLAGELELIQSMPKHGGQQEPRFGSGHPYHLLGVDLFVSASLDMHVIEVNGLPSLSQQIQDDGYRYLKHSLLHAVFNVLGVCDGRTGSRTSGQHPQRQRQPGLGRRSRGRSSGRGDGNGDGLHAQQEVFMRVTREQTHRAAAGTRVVGRGKAAPSYESTRMRLLLPACTSKEERWARQTGTAQPALRAAWDMTEIDYALLSSSSQPEFPLLTSQSLCATPNR